jgi:hypothetical protein
VAQQGEVQKSQQAQQGETEEITRDKALEALAILSTGDFTLLEEDLVHPDQFLKGMRTDVESTLWDYGFALSSQEMQDVKAFLEETTSLSDEEFVERIKSRKKRW